MFVVSYKKVIVRTSDSNRHTLLEIRLFVFKMLTPNFQVDQTNDFVLIDIYAPHSRIERTEVEVIDNLIIFSSPPYYLRINLPGQVEPPEAANAHACQWDGEQKSYHLQVPKVVKGEHFDGLDMITRLLTIPNAGQTVKTKPSIEVIATSTFSDNDDDERDQNYQEPVNSLYDDKDDESNQFYIEQKVIPEISMTAAGQHCYGFNQSYFGIIERFNGQISNLIDLVHPGQTAPAVRTEQRMMQEQLDFKDEHYLVDLYENDVTICQLIGYEQFWCRSGEEHGKFTEDETFRLKNLPRRQYCLDGRQRRSLIYGLVDILFAYAYDRRVNEGDECSESGWNVTKLSATLSWFERFERLQDVIVTCLRRSLCYPLYRHFSLSKQVLQDVVSLLRAGPIAVIKVMLHLQRLFNEDGDFRYLLNDLYITDYCVWLQSASVAAKHLSQLADLLAERSSFVDKGSLHLDLELLEQAAECAVQEELEDGLQQIRIM